MEKRSYLSRIALIGWMVVLLFVVLSTATYAWFSANNVASAGTVIFRSSAADAGGLLTIGKDKNAVGNELEFDVPGDINPMIPVANGVAGTTKLPQFMQFQKTYEGLNEAGQLVAMLDGSAASPIMLSVEKQTYFYLNNISAETDIPVKVNYTVTGDLASKLHIAMFVGEKEADAVLLGVLSGSGEIHYGAIRLGELVNDKPVMENAYKPTGDISIVVPHNGSVCIRLAAWLDGVNMKNENGNQTTGFALSFRGE